MNNEKIQDGLKKFLKLLIKNKYVLIVLIVGLIILLIPTDSSKSSKETASGAQSETTEVSEVFDLEAQEEKIASALSEIEGAGEVTVVLTLKSSIEQEVAVDEDGSGSKETVIVSNGTSSESPVTIKYNYPEYQGALIVAKGANSATVKLAITQAVASLTGLGADKITVINKEN